MATTQKIKELNDVFSAMASIDRGALLRKNIGDESLGDVLQPILNDLDSKAEFARSYAKGVNDTALEGIRASFAAIVTILTAQAARSNTDYIANKPTILTQINENMEGLLTYWPSLVAAAVVERGFLQDEGIRK